MFLVRIPVIKCALMFMCVCVCVCELAEVSIDKPVNKQENNLKKLIYNCGKCKLLCLKVSVAIQHYNIWYYKMKEEFRECYFWFIQKKNTIKEGYHHTTIHVHKTNNHFYLIFIKYFRYRSHRDAKPEFIL